MTSCLLVYGTFEQCVHKIFAIDCPLIFPKFCTVLFFEIHYIRIVGVVIIMWFYITFTDSAIFQLYV